MDYSNLTDQQVDDDNKRSIMNGPAEAYLHGNAASMLYKAIKASAEKGMRVCITSTKGIFSFSEFCRLAIIFIKEFIDHVCLLTRRYHLQLVDGVVFFLTPNGHSLNYRSAVLHGTASLVPNTEVQKKQWAMRLLTNHMWPDRWESTYPVAQSAMRGVQVIEVKIRSASSKIRASNIGDFEPAVVLGQSPDWQKKDVWSGVVPVHEHFGKPVSSGVMDGVERRNATDNLRRIEMVRLDRNEKAENYSEKVATAGPVERNMQERVKVWKQTL
jgi:hypothetical protein